MRDELRENGDGELTAVHRVHFNDLMQRVYETLHKYRTADRERRAELDDTIDAIIEPLMGAARDDDGTIVLCLDEIQVVDVVDAVILRQVLGRLFERGNVVLVTTSNVDPPGLYRSGIRREDFVPLVSLLLRFLSKTFRWWTWTHAVVGRSLLWSRIVVWSR